MRIAIISDTGLPDARVEKEMLSLIKNNHSLTFIGPVRGTTGILNSNELEKINFIDLSWRREVRLKIEPYYSWFKRKIKRILNYVKPDVVLSINIFSGIVVHELGYPMVLDDHELYSLETQATITSGIIKKIINSYKILLFEKIEKTISQNHPVLVVSNEMKKHYIEAYGASKSKVIVIKNYPSLREIKHSEFRKLNCNKIVFSYIGKDLIYDYGKTYRNMKVTVEILCKLGRLYPDKFSVILLGETKRPCKIIKSQGYVKHTSMYQYVASSHYGLLTWEPSWFHRFCNPNKPYIYAISGAIPIVTSDIVDVIRDFKNKEIITIDAAYFRSKLEETLHGLIINTDCDELNNRRYKLRNFMIRNLLWDNQESKILEAIRIA